MADEVALTVRTNKTTFPVTDSTQLAYVLIEAMPTGEAVDVQMPLNFSLVLDHSGSMSGKKIENLKEAAKLAIDQMSPEDLVSVIIFNDSVQLIAPSQPVADPEALKAEIDDIDAAGGTNISFAMRDSLDELAKGMAPERVNRMLLLTDGETYGDEDECRRLAAEAGRQDVQVTALGLGDDWIEALLDDIATASGGLVDFLPEDKPEVVLQTFERAVKSAQATVVQDVMMLLRLVPGVMPRAVWRVTPMITKLGHRAISERDVQVELGDLERETGQSVLVELMVSPRQPGTYRLAQAEVDYSVVALGLTGEKVKSDVILSFSADPEAVSEAASDRDPYVLNIVEKVTAHKLQTRALDEAAAGNIAGATQKLRAAATRLLSVGEEDLAETASDEATRLEQGGKLSSEGTKKLRYETRKLTQKLDDV
jgi:Ca-activated chloride channel family protein